MQQNLADTGVHDHIFHESNLNAERGTKWVAWITAVMMIVEILTGWWYNSMALLADGWHMSSHTLAIGLSALAYVQARKYAKDTSFAFGTWKIEVLSGFTSALFLVAIAVAMVYGSFERLMSPQIIHYKEAIFVAVLGLVVNLLCAFILSHSHASDSEPPTKDLNKHHKHDHDHDHHHHHEYHHQHHDHDHRHHDLNLRSAYIHVVADAATSVLAVIALVGGMFYGWSWLDPVMGMVGALLVAVWAKNLISETAKVLVDKEMDDPIVFQVKERMVSLPLTSITDLHLWRVGKRAYCCAMSLVTRDANLTPSLVKQHLLEIPQIAHSTIEVHLQK